MERPFLFATRQKGVHYDEYMDVSTHARFSVKLIIAAFVFCFIVVGVFFAMRMTRQESIVSERHYACSEFIPTTMCGKIQGPVCATIAIQCVTTPCDPIQETLESACAACDNGLVTSFRIGACAMPELATSTPIVFDERPINFVRIGTVVFGNPGLKKDTPYLIYEEAGAPALYKELVFDEQSSCAVSGGGIPCLAMSATFDVPFAGKPALVEGIAQDDRVIVRFIRRLEGVESIPMSPPGSLFVTWPTVVRLMESCAVRGAFQSHALDVAVSLKDGRSLRTVEPVIDEIFKVEERTRAVCGSITIATE